MGRGSMRLGAALGGMVFFGWLLSAGSAAAQAVQLPQTGQTACYDASGTAILCVGTGHDGELRAGIPWPEPRFTDHGDGTVTDRLTGLMWTQNANLAGAMYWPDALAYVADMNAGLHPNFGHADWRLPNINEQFSLMDAAHASPTLPPGAPFVGMPAYGNTYWSSTTDTHQSGYQSNAWTVDMRSGIVSSGSKAPPYAFVQHLFWPVRDSGTPGPAEVPATGQVTCYDALGTGIPCAGTGQDGEVRAGVPWPAPRFTDHGDGTVTDHLTGLMWTKDASPLPLSPSGWPDALDHVAAMNAGLLPNYGHTDWRLPNRRELDSLKKFEGPTASPSLSPYYAPFLGPNVYATYWTSTTAEGAPLYNQKGVWTLSFDSGQEFVFCCKAPGLLAYQMWPVRGGPVQAEFSDVAVSAVGATEATVTWSTTVPMTSHVTFGLVAPGEDGAGDDFTLTTMHSVTLTGLDPETSYQFQVAGRRVTTPLPVDPADVLYGPAGAFSTVPVTFSDVAVSGITETEATVTWTTNAPLTSHVQFSTGGGPLDGAGDDVTLVTAHSVTLTGLMPDTHYDFQIIGRLVTTLPVQPEELIYGPTGSFATLLLNTAPTVDAGPGGTVAEGDPFTGAGAFTDPDADTWTATVDYGDGTGVQPLALAADMTFALAHTYADDGSYTVTVTVTDSDGAAGTDTAAVGVYNVPPTVDAGPDAGTDLDGLFAGAGGFFDPGADAWTATVDYGDGAGAQPLALAADMTFALGHDYAASGAYTVTVSVTDDDGGVGSDDLQVTAIIDTDRDGIPDEADACPTENASGFDADQDGCIDTLGGLQDDLTTLVAEGVIDATMEDSLVSKVANAEAKADKENICAAVNEMEAFKSQIEAQRDKKISSEAADLLIAYADNVIQGLIAMLPEGQTCG